VYQMTSTVEGRLLPKTSLLDVLRAVLPAGSVTGTPKIRACAIIDRLEGTARGVYCGHIGWFAPNEDFALNVAIRTIVHNGSRYELGVGSGIVADSEPRAELAETRLKGAFINSAPMDFRLLETLLWRMPDGYALRDAHISRMRRSARYFGWRFPEAAVRSALDQAAFLAGQDDRRSAARIRLLLDRHGRCATQLTVLDDAALERSNARLWLSPHRTDPSDVFVFHKTTRRARFDVDRREALARGCFDALYANTRGEITEGAVTSVLIEIDGAWRTPPLSSGLLPGIWRALELRSGLVKTCRLRIEDLSRAQRIRIGNSVRGSVEIENVVDAHDRVLFQRRAITSS
jgi:para-aminobenzoate synthetase/4-amino-4-deoxychorismate lyase